MATSVTLTGYPEVLRVWIYQGDGAEPGSIVVDTLHEGDASITDLPTTTDLTIVHESYTGIWQDIRIKRSPRVFRGHLRTVFEDSRWKLRDATMGGQFNRRSMTGHLAAVTTQSIAQLVDKIESATGLTITTGTVPSINPPAIWTGLTADKAMSDLLHDAVLRMVYNPTDQEYKIATAGSGTEPTVTNQVTVDPPLPRFRNLIVRSAPILFEDEIAVRCMQIDPSGNIVVNNSPSIPLSYTWWEQHDLRLWGPTSVSYPEALAVSQIQINPHRAISIVPAGTDAPMISATIFVDNFREIPFHRPLHYSAGNRAVHTIRDTAGSQAVLFEHPILCGNGGGGYIVDGTMITSYYVIESDGTLRRQTNSQSIDISESEDMIVDMPWITPISSNMADVGASTWGTLLTTIATALSTKYDTDRYTVRSITPIDHGGSAKVGAQCFHFDVENIARTNCTLAINFDPGPVSSGRIAS